MKTPGPWSRKVTVLTDIRNFVRDHRSELEDQDYGEILIFLDALTVRGWDPPATLEARHQLQDLL